MIIIIIIVFMLPVVFYVTKDHVLNHYRDIYIYFHFYL